MILNLEIKNLKNTMTKINLCICTKDRPFELEKCLKSIEKSKTKPSLIIISDDSKDKENIIKSKKIISNFGKSLNIKYVKGPRKGLGANRNNCLKFIEKDADYIHFLDDDALIEPNFYEIMLKKIKENIRNKKIIYTGKEIRNGHIVEPRNLDFFGYFNIETKKPETFVINATLFPKNLFNKIKFDELLKYGADETDIALKSKKIGYKVVYIKDAFVIHNHSKIGRKENEKYVNFSRSYVMLKRYAIFEKNILKFILYTLLAGAKSISKGHFFSFWNALMSFIKNKKKEEL